MSWHQNTADVYNTQTYSKSKKQVIMTTSDIGILLRVLVMGQGTSPNIQGNMCTHNSN